MSFDIQLQGGAELAKLLEAMPDRMLNNVMRGAMHAGAVVIRDAARAHAPIGSPPLPEGHPPHHLRDNIVAGGGGVRGDVASALVGVTSHGFYGRFVEFGHAMVSHGRKRVGTVPAHPFMRPAADESAGAAAQAVVDYASRRVVEGALGKEATFYELGWEES